MSTLRSMARLAAMVRYFLTRLATAIPTLFIIVSVAFFAMRAAPGTVPAQTEARREELSDGAKR